MLINVKIPTSIGIITFMSKIKFMLSSVEHETSFISSSPGYKEEDMMSVYNLSALTIGTVNHRAG